jgi:hypothetical protein
VTVQAQLKEVGPRADGSGVLFLGREEKAAARAEANRLRRLPPGEIAVEIMGAFGPNGPPTDRKIWVGARGIEILQLCDWLMRAHPRGYRQRGRLRAAVVRGIRVLVSAGLVENEHRRFSQPGARLAKLRATTAGERSLAEGTVAREIEQSAS